MKKLNSIEYLRAFSMLYIVGYWHLFNYTDAFPDYRNSYTSKLTLIVLGLFVFISGFLLGCKAEKSSSLLNFYKKRLARIYPLYVLAVILFYLLGINDGLTSFKSMFFISMYYGPSPRTLWFVTMLMLFYLATPLFLKLLAKPLNYLMFVIALFAVTFALGITFKTVDYRILLYLPCFCVGIYSSHYGFKTRVVNFKSALLLFCVYLILSFFDEVDSWIFNHLIKAIPMILSCSYLIFLIIYLNEDRFKSLKIISMLSYSSYAMYLFHRPIYKTLKALYFPESAQFQVLYLITIGLVMVFFISWGLQKLYDTGCVLLSKTN